MRRRASMVWLVGLALPAVCAGIAWGDRPELNESQRVRLETADDGSRTVDEAAFYALLENAADWPDDAGAAGAVVPDYGALSEEPGDWRGRLCLIEGRLEMALPESDLSRSGWDRVRGLVIRTEGEAEDGGGEMGQPIVLYVTQPPELEPTWINENVLKQRGWGVRAVGRFYKMVDWASRGGERSTYPVFVGKGLSRFGPSGGGSGGSGGSGPGGGFSPGSVAMFGLVLILAAGYLIYRVVALRKRFRGGGRLAEYRKEREAARARAEAETTAPENEQQTDLPEDPAAAMEILAQQHGEGEVSDEANPSPDSGLSDSRAEPDSSRSDAERS